MGNVTVKPLSTHWKKQLAGEINYIKVWQRRINTTSSNKTGGLKAAATNRAKHGDDFYKRMGSKGGRKLGVKKGFAVMTPEQRRAYGKKGGLKSRRTGIKTGEGKSYKPYYDGTERRPSVTKKPTPKPKVESKSVKEEKANMNWIKRIFGGK